MKETDEEINRTLETLKSGGVIIYPTDTIWGIGCDATNSEAVKKVFAIKQRAENKSLIILVDDENKLEGYVKEVPPVAWELIEYAEKPLTIIYPGAKNLAPEVVAEDGTVAIRLVRDEFCKKLIQKFRKPIVSTSCNISGEPNAVTYKDINPRILEQADYVVNLRREDSNPARPSTIIKLEVNGVFKFIRK